MLSTYPTYNIFSIENEIKPPKQREMPIISFSLSQFHRKEFHPSRSTQYNPNSSVGITRGIIYNRRHVDRTHVPDVSTQTHPSRIWRPIEYDPQIILWSCYGNNTRLTLAPDNPCRVNWCGCVMRDPLNTLSHFIVHYCFVSDHRYWYDKPFIRGSW